MMPSLKSLQFIYRKHYDSKIVQFQRHLHKSFCRAIILSLADTLSFFFFWIQSESASIRDEELQGLRQQHALLKKMLEQQQQVQNQRINKFQLMFL